MKIEKKFMKMFSKDCCVPKLYFFKQQHNAFIPFFCQAAIDQVEKFSKLPLKKEKEKG